MLLLILILEAVALWQARRLARLEREVAKLRGRLDDLRPEPAAPVPDAAEAEPSLASTAEDWETRLGANWLNRLGALILVIGVVLFLGYSLTRMGAEGKVTIGLAAGLCLLGAGVAAERFEAWRSYSFSLMGAGWAILYFTAYASHAVPEARVIAEPGAAVVLLLAVSAGMIAHSVRYRSETATALAFLLGYAGLAFSPLTSFTAPAMLMLVVSLNVVAWRFGWFRLPLLAAALVYIGFVVRAEVAGVPGSQAALWAFWIAFEAFDLLDLRRRGGERGLERTLFLVNAAGFTGASLLLQWRAEPAHWWIFLAAASAAYLANSLLRTRVAGTAPGVTGGGYEPAAAISAGFLAFALIDRFAGPSIAVALLFEAELVLLAGAGAGAPLLLRTGAVLLVLPVLRLLLWDVPAGGTFTVAGFELFRWTPAALLTALTLAVNRWRFARGWYFTAGAAVLAGVTAAAELPELWAAPLIAAAGVVLTLSVSVDIALAGAAALAWAFVHALIEDLPAHHVPGSATVVAALYAAQFAWRQPVRGVRAGLSMLGTALLTALISEESPPKLFTAFCGIEAGVLLTAGLLLRERVLRLSGLALFVVCLLRLFLYDLRALDAGGRIVSFIVLGLVLLGASWVYSKRPLSTV